MNMPNMAQSGKMVAESVWAFYTEMLLMGAEKEVALQLTANFMDSILRQVPPPPKPTEPTED